MVKALRNNLSFVFALVIILGAVGVGAYRQKLGQRTSERLQLFEPMTDGEDQADDDADGRGELLAQQDAADPFDGDDDSEAVDEPLPTEPEVEPDRPPDDLVMALAKLGSAAEEGRYLVPEQDSVAWWADSALRVDPTQEDALVALARLVDDITALGAGKLPEEDLPGAEVTLETLKRIEPDSTRTAAVQTVVDSAKELLTRLRRSESLLAEEGLSTRQLMRAAGGFQAVLAIDDGNPAATKGIEAVQRRLVDLALAAAQDFDFAAADATIEQARSLQERSRVVNSASAQLMAFRAQSEADLLAEFDSALDSRDVETARRALNRLRKFLDDSRRLRALSRKLTNAELYAGYAPGETFTDSLRGGGRGPRMVVIPIGRFLMGSPESEEGRNRNEGPQRELAFSKGFAMGQTEVTVGDFRAFVEATGYVTEVEQEGRSDTYEERTGRLVLRRGVTWQRDYKGSRARDTEPVLHVSWNDAAAYANWLSEASASVYRLPSEAEFEYSLRAGTQTRYWWGDGAPDRVLANLTGAEDVSKGKRRWANGFPDYGDGFWGTAPVRSYEANPFGLFDIDGNASEWVADCWHDNYSRAPNGTQPWVNPGCELRVVRGGSWGSSPEQSRSAYRTGNGVEKGGARVGFRVAREL
ncbi:MAG: formylglycine-generating enzyme family protein [Xanthomonadales bacterium]|nr:formylglycine-generating enzyme family protein [Xanthomonadales bacterium]